MAALKTYVYISETKVKMLYDQIEEQQRSTSREVGIDIKFFKAGIKTDVAPRTTLISKLNRVMDVLTNGGQIGSLQEPKHLVADKFRAPTQELEFVARQYVVGKSKTARRRKVLIGSPIYVALAE